MDEEFDIDLKVNDKAIDRSIAKIKTYERLVKRVFGPRGSGTAGMAGGVGYGGGFGAAVGASGGFANSGITSLLTSQVAALKSEQGMQASGMAFKAIGSDMFGNNRIDRPRLSGPNGITSPLRIGHTPTLALGYDGGTNQNIDKVRRARERRRARGSKGFRIKRPNAAVKQVNDWFSARIEQISTALGTGLRGGMGGIGKSSAAGAIRRLGMGIGAMLPLPIVGAAVGYAIGGFAEVAIDKIINADAEGMRIRGDIMKNYLKGTASQYTRKFTTAQMKLHSQSKDAMRDQLIKDEVAKGPMFTHAGFTGMSLSTVRSAVGPHVIDMERKNQEREYKRRVQGVSDIDNSEMNARRVEETLRQMLRF